MGRAKGCTGKRIPLGAGSAFTDAVSSAGYEFLGPASGIAVQIQQIYQRKNTHINAHKNQPGGPGVGPPG